MTALRLISLPAHGALELLGGFALMASPFVFGFGPAGVVTAVLLGALLVGLALSTASPDGDTLSVAAHHSFDYGIAIGLLGGALVLALADDRPAAIALLAASVAQFALNISTRYIATA